MKSVDPLFIYYSFFRWKTKADLSYNEDIKGGSKQKETKQNQLHSSKASEII